MKKKNLILYLHCFTQKSCQHESNPGTNCETNSEIKISTESVMPQMIPVSSPGIDAATSYII
ncbi:MAG: hypothetical protein ACLQBQ_03355 [Smithella sp.]